MNDSIKLVLDDDGTFHEKPEIFANIMVDTEESWNALQDIVNRGNRMRWVSVKDKLPEMNEEGYTDNVLVYIPKREGCRQHGIFIGKKQFVKGSDGSDNFFGIKTEDCEWLVWSWGYFEHPIVTHWMPLPAPPEKENGDESDA